MPGLRQREAADRGLHSAWGGRGPGNILLSCCPAPAGVPPLDGGPRLRQWAGPCPSPLQLRTGRSLTSPPAQLPPEGLDRLFRRGAGPRPSPHGDTCRQRVRRPHQAAVSQGSRGEQAENPATPFLAQISNHIHLLKGASLRDSSQPRCPLTGSSLRFGPFRAG